MLAARIRAIEYKEVLVFEMRRAFDGHRSANIVISGVDFIAREPKLTNEIEARGFILFCGESEALERAFAERPVVERKAELENGRQCSFDIL